MTTTDTPSTLVVQAETQPDSAPPVVTGRDHAGRFAPGNRLSPGRKPRIDFRSVAQKRAEAEGIDLADALWDVFNAQLDRAKAGATDAARFVFGLLAEVDDDVLSLHVATDGLSDTERATRVQSLLAIAALRRGGSRD